MFVRTKKQKNNKIKVRDQVSIVVDTATDKHYTIPSNSYDILIKIYHITPCRIRAKN